MTKPILIGLWQEFSMSKYKYGEDDPVERQWYWIRGTWVKDGRMYHTVYQPQRHD